MGGGRELGTARRPDRRSRRAGRRPHRAGQVRGAHDLSGANGRLRSHGGLHERAVPIIVSRPLEQDWLRGRTLHNRDLHDVLLNHLA